MVIKKCSRVMLSVLLVCLVLAVPVSAGQYEGNFRDDFEEITEYAYSFAFLGDTQNVTFFDPDQLHMLTDWIVENAEEKNIKFACGLGDITEYSKDYEWEAAVDAYQRLDGVVRYSLVRGNHDRLYDFSRRFRYDTYTSQLDGMYSGVLNTYLTFSVGTIDYLVINLDWGPSDEVLQWACEVVEAHPKHNVIITTHGYLLKSGKLISAENHTVAPTLKQGYNDGPQIWDQLVRKYENIVMVISGHIPSEPVSIAHEATGDHGNKIMHVLINPSDVDEFEGSSGIVTMLYFSADGTEVLVQNYATIKEMYYGEKLTFTVNCLGGNANAVPVNWPFLIAVGAGVLAVASVAVFLFYKMKRAVNE